MMRTEKKRGFQRCVGWCEAQFGLFLLTSEQSSRNARRSWDSAHGVGKNGQPPLSVLSGAHAQFEWYRGDTSSSQFSETGTFIFCKYLFALWQKGNINEIRALIS